MSLSPPRWEHLPGHICSLSLKPSSLLRTWSHSHPDTEAEQRVREMGYGGEARKERASEAESMGTHLHGKNIMGIKKDVAGYRPGTGRHPAIPAPQRDTEGSQVPGQPWLSILAVSEAKIETLQK